MLSRAAPKKEAPAPLAIVKPCLLGSRPAKSALLPGMEKISFVKPAAVVGVRSAAAVARPEAARHVDVGRCPEVGRPAARAGGQVRIRFERCGLRRARDRQGGDPSGGTGAVNRARIASIIAGEKIAPRE